MDSGVQASHGRNECTDLIEDAVIQACIDDKSLKWCQVHIGNRVIVPGPFLGAFREFANPFVEHGEFGGQGLYRADATFIAGQPLALLQSLLHVCNAFALTDEFLGNFVCLLRGFTCSKPRKNPDEAYHDGCDDRTHFHVAYLPFFTMR